MLELQKKQHEVRMERDKELYERQIRIVDTQIDRRVYDLYGLSNNSKIQRERKAHKAINSKRSKIFGVKSNCETAS